MKTDFLLVPCSSEMRSRRAPDLLSRSIDVLSIPRPPQIEQIPPVLPLQESPQLGTKHLVKII